MVTGLHLCLAAALAGGIGVVGAWYRGSADGHARCVGEQAQAALAQQAEADQRYRAAIAWGNQISQDLAAKQREVQTLRSQHESAARDLVGTCPVGLRVLHDAAASGRDLSATPHPSLDAPGTVDASHIGAAVAGNYARARACQAQLTALIDFIEAQK